MRILLVGNYELDAQASMLRYARMLQSHLAALGHQVELMQPPVVAGRVLRQSTAHKWLGYIDKYILFPRRLRHRSDAFDCVHVCDHSNSMYLAQVRGAAASITCHDLLAVRSARGDFPQVTKSLSGRVQQRWILRHLAAAENVVCVSAHTAEQLAELAPNPVRRAVVIPNALDEDCRPASAAEVAQMRSSVGLAADEPYLFHVGGNHWYKNRMGVLRIFARLRELLARDGGRPVRLLMAGDAFSPEMRSYVAAELPEGSVVEAVRPPDALLWAMYSGATALLFPSLYEGFGWPLAEAQRCGCPVITSNRPPMPEVAGAAALYIDPADEAGAAELIAARLDRLAELREAGFANARRFAASEVFAAYERFFEDCTPPPR